MCGVGFSGKSTLAKKIAEHTGGILISQDALFFEKKDEMHLDLDNEEHWKMLLEMCRKQILENLQEGKSVVFDDVNLAFKRREKLRQLAQSAGAKTKVIFLDTPITLQKERQLKNKETGERHDVKQEYLDQAIAELEVPTPDENTLVFKPNSNLESFLLSL